METLHEKIKCIIKETMWHYEPTDRIAEAAADKIYDAIKDYPPTEAK